MKQRLLVAGIGIPILLVILLACPPWAVMLMSALIAGVAAYELLRTAGKGVTTDLYAVTIAITALRTGSLFVSLPAWPLARISISDILLWALLMYLFAYAVVHYEHEEKTVPFATVAAAFFAGAVFPALYVCIALLRAEEPFGRIYVLAVFCTAFVGDSFSMGAGSWFGKKKMAPRVSPHKTWAGAAAGPVGAAAALCILGLVGRFVWGYLPNYGMLILAGAVANVFGQLGDLATSFIKREAGVKDYSRLFLTHGGMLDRFDSTMLIAPVLYFFVEAGVL